jgi:hypothetical protein
VPRTRILAIPCGLVGMLALGWYLGSGDVPPLNRAWEPSASEPQTVVSGDRRLQESSATTTRAYSSDDQERQTRRSSRRLRITPLAKPQDGGEAVVVEDGRRP